jgi:two-component system OmpR family sensor kinase
VGQRTVIRNGIALHAGLWTAVPLLLMVPILSGVIFLLVRRMLKPIAELSSDLDHRGDFDLNPVRSDELPSEIVPIVSAINRLLGRLGHSMEIKRRFIADAAHELRSPLAALSIQLKNVFRLVSDREAVLRLKELAGGIERAGALIGKLLDLARVQSPMTRDIASCRVDATLRSVLEELLPSASARDIEIQVTNAEDLIVELSELDLGLILRNLLDNAIRYSGPNSLVEVRSWKTERGACIAVADEGPGIPVSERERVFDPFYRMLGNEPPGSGLGLAIVRAIVERLGGSVELDWTLKDPPRGLRVEVLLPVRVSSQARRQACSSSDNCVAATDSMHGVGN